MQFRKGDLISLLGPSGCGKTTVLKMMGGLIPASGGLLELDGKAITGPFPGVGVVFQAPTLMPWRSVLGNVLFPMEVLGKNDRKAKKRARGDSRPDRTGGLRAGLSAATVGRHAAARRAVPRHHSRALDPADGRAVRRARRIDPAGDERSAAGYLRRVTGATVIFVTHSISEAIYLSDRVFVFSKRPAVIALELDVDIPYPRSQQTRFLEEFTELERQASIALGVVKQ